MAYYVSNLPEDLPAKEAAIFESRISIAYNDLKKHCKKDLDDLIVSFKPSLAYTIRQGEPGGDYSVVGNQVFHREAGDDYSAVGGAIFNDSSLKPENSQEEDLLPGSSLSAVEPKFQFEQLILPSETLEEIRHKISLFQLKNKVFEEWGLKKIEPYPRSALNFYGKPGTGKTMAAHAIAQLLGKKIILATYAEIESKYHGDGPKNVKAVFKKAEDEDAVLFIDEADSLLSQRLSNVTQGSEQAINSMRSQLLICLEKFSGLVIFSTNFVEQYDKAFETRVSNIEFKMPDADGRAKIWKQHLPATLPLKDDVDITALAEEVDDICGRDIKNAVIDAALKVAYAQAHNGRTQPIGMADLKDSILRIKSARIKKEGTPLSAEETKKIEAQLQAKFRKDKSSARKKKKD